MRDSLRKSDYSSGVLLAPSLNPRRYKNRLRGSRSSQALALVIAMLLVSSNFLVRVKAADGNLDSTFGIGGKVITDFFGAGDIGNDVAVQPDGKIIVPGRVVTGSGFSDFGLARYNSDGTPDASFGSGGKVNTDFFGFDDGCLAVALQTDGKIVAAGGAFSDAVAGTNDFALARYNGDGTLDATFGSGGKVVADFGGGINDQAPDVALQSDGKIVVVVGTAILGNSDFIVARYNSDGTPDPTFGIGGSVTTDFFGGDDQCVAVAIQGDGKIIVAGFVSIDLDNSDFALARYNSDGTPDPTFGSGGKVTTDFFGSFDGASGVVVQSDGKIVAAGAAIVDFATSNDFAVARYNADGTPDASFGIGGKVTTDFSGNDAAADVVLQCDGKIVVAGVADSSNTSGDVAVARYQSDGTLDPSFEADGKVVTDFLGHDSSRGVGLQSDGRIVVAGSTRADDSFDSLEFALARYEGSSCVAAPCPEPHGYWKNDPSTWPVDSLMLGSQAYSKTELLVILKTSTQTDASLILARQLIAAKLNIENGSDPSPVSNVIADADALLVGLGGKLPYKVKPSSGTGHAMTDDAAVLNSYNKGLLTPGCAP